jgi:hypothetical protein
MHIVVEYFNVNYISTFITFTSDKLPTVGFKRYTCYILVANEEEMSACGGILISPALCFQS